MWVSDFGAGFDVRTASGHGGIGLASMRERLHAVGGEINIVSKPDHGTRIEARAPLHHKATEPESAGFQGASIKTDL